MEEVKILIDNLIKGNTTDPIGYSIYGYELNGSRNYDIYLPTKAMDYFYFMYYKSGHFYDIDLNLSDPNNYKRFRIPTQYLIERNFIKILIYDEFLIAEHDELSTSEYQDPTENNAEEYLNVGYEAVQNGDYDEAFRNYSKAINEKPYDPSLYRARANVFAKRNKSKNTIEDVCRGGIANPISNQNVFTFTYEGLAEIYRREQDFKTAIKYYTIAIYDGFQIWNIRERAKCYAEIGSFENAISDMKLFIEKDKTTTIKSLFELGEIYLKASLNKEAQETFKEVVNFLPDYDDQEYRKRFELRNMPLKDKAKLHLQKFN